MFRSLPAAFFLSVLASAPALAQGAPAQRSSQAPAVAQMTGPAQQGGVLTCQSGATCAVSCGEKRYQGVRVARLSPLSGFSTVVMYDGASKVIASLLVGSSHVCSFDGMELARES